MKLSEHFDSKEFSCPCCGKVEVSPRLVSALEVLRAAVGGKAIRINSGYRCPSHNKSVGGVQNSQHVLGLAVDVYVEGLSGQGIYDAASSISAFHGFGVAPGWAHLDVRESPVVRWRYTATGKQRAW